MTLFSNRAPKVHIDGDIAIVSFCGVGEDQHSNVTLCTVAMTRHALLAHIALCGKALKDIQTAETKIADFAEADEQRGDTATF